MRRFVLMAVLFLAACATVSHAPEVSLAGIEVVEIGLLEQRFGLRLRFLNPNDAELRLDGLSYELEVNGQPFARGVSPQAVTVPRYGEAVVEVSAVSNLAGLLRQVNEMRREERRTLEYKLTGKANVGGLGRLPFEHRGEVALPRGLDEPGA